MLALIGRVLEKTLNSLIGENKTPWRKCGYNTFLAFSVKSAGTLVPPKGCSLGWDKRKTTLEAAWKALSAINKKFSMQGFHNTTNNDDSLAADKIQLYDPLYEDLVTTTKPSMSLAKDSRKH
ncbi:hypothetical protein KEM48_001734 [Puccinia striiformis f. sp. tritici PST-130]|nr:hypothetical protein KEM48_001734 [Puccinia striiformis f. sp. tritici PST-130]